MSDQEPKFELPRNIERYLAALSKLYAQENKKQLQTIIVNSQIRVNEGWSYDNWDGGTYGHALYLVIPETLYLSVLKNRDAIQQQICEGINKLHNVQGEFIEAVFLEIEVTEDQDWRKESGLLLSGQRVIAPEAESRVWGDEGYRVFLSHKNEVKKETAELKEKLQLFGISGFVAHEDIHPTKEWQDEIENALFTMDAFVALMTEGFHDSLWSDRSGCCLWTRRTDYLGKTREISIWFYWKISGTFLFMGLVCKRNCKNFSEARWDVKCIYQSRRELFHI